MITHVYKHEFKTNALGPYTHASYTCETVKVLADRETDIVLDDRLAIVISKAGTPKDYYDRVLDVPTLADADDSPTVSKGGFAFTLFASRKRSADEVKSMIKWAIDGKIRKRFAYLIDADLSAVKDWTMTLQQAQETFPVGTKVKYFPVMGEKAFRECEVRSEPWVLGHGAVVVKVTGMAGGVSVKHLERIEP